jgi:hypothetical protein
LAEVFWAESARSALTDLILSHSLPADATQRVTQSLRPLERFPRLGPELKRLGEGQELRFVIGPWPWLVLVYLYDETRDHVVIVSPEDGRSAISTRMRAGSS